MAEQKNQVGSMRPIDYFSDKRILEADVHRYVVEPLRQTVLAAEKRGLRTMDQYVKVGKAGLKELPGMGEKMLRNVETILSRDGIQLSA